MSKKNKLIQEELDIPVKPQESSQEVEKSPKVEEEVLAKTETEAPKVEKQTTKFDFSDEDVAEFVQWKKAKEVQAQVRADSPDDDKVYRMWKEESRLVKGVFRCMEPAGGCVRFCFRKYKWDPVQWYTMYDGETYEVPLSVARHLNQNCNVPVHSHVLDSQGKPTLDVKGKTRSRMNFESTLFAVA
jgi:hypothetical protein